MFRNADLVTHDVRIAAGAFDSGPLGRFGSWTQAFDTPGEYPFLCTLHPFMSGTLSVVAATLAASPDGVLAGQPLTLSGRARAGTAALGLERAAPTGPGLALPTGSRRRPTARTRSRRRPSRARLPRDDAVGASRA